MGSEFVDKFRREAEKILREKRIRTIEFSGSTYQVEVEEEEVFWPFLQFDEEDNLSDAFCSCGADDACPHLAAAFLRIYNGFAHPLHTRFKSSFWFHLTFLFADIFGTKSKKTMSEGGRQFSISAKNTTGKKKISAWIEKRSKETPETSLKFSNLSQEEITRWKEGRPTSTLRYELSFWSDLAKYLMFIQEEKSPLTIDFEEIKGLPLHLHLETNDLKIDFKFLEEDLEILIPTLGTIPSSLKVQRLGENGITSIVYVPEEKLFRVERKEKKSLPHKKGEKIGKWIYVSGEGFYSSQMKTLLDKSEIHEDEISSFLTTHLDEISKFLPNLIHKTPVAASYHLEFDKVWNLHFSFYLFEKGDATLLGGWAYVKEKGFYPLKGLLFENAEKIIPPEEVSSFIHYHRNFLNTTPGFSIHLASVESAIIYEITEGGTLRFLSKFSESNLEMKDFGDWVYYRGQGFFPKKAPGPTSVLFAGLEVTPRDVPSFIKIHREELETIPQFFAMRPLVAARGLSLKVTSENSVEIEPKVVLFDEVKKNRMRVFGDFIFLEGLGFEEMPPQMRLPVKFQSKIILHEEDLPYFFEEEFDHLKSLFIELDPRAKIPRKLEIHLHTLVKAPDGIEIEGDYVSEWGKISLQALREQMEKNQRYLFSSAGLLDLTSPRFEWIEKLKKEERFTLTTLDFLRLDIEEGVHSTKDDVMRTLDELRSFHTHDEPVTDSLKSHLRTYQKTGLDWLWFLYRNGLSGLLSDEMGLGKTHQAMALLAASAHFLREEKQTDFRFLIVAPTSVIYHWEEKLEAFLPDFKVHFFHGLKRSLKRLPKTGILLTSYGILRSEREEIEKIPFEIAIFDEIQVAKNPASRIHDALSAIQAKTKIGLTGTPIENYLRELKSLFDLILPTYMPGEKEFRQNFTLPIEKEGDVEKKALLSRLIKPFILRRKKQEVLSELPEKTEDKILCDLSPEQLTLYQTMLEKERKPILEQLQKGSGPIPYVHIFSIISKLKQICNHPALYLKEPENYLKHDCGKWDLFVELLTEALSGEQKVVVFSQYLQMLDIIENYLQSQSINYAQIRGETLDRKEQMERFREDPRCLVFLGSLQAAGLGIDLTSASIVILYDRWWNAARENQAIDRVHRIGQKWGVQVYKLITKGTVEEKIDQMITRKGQLMEEIVTADDEGTIKRFSREELIELLTFPRE